MSARYRCYPLTVSVFAFPTALMTTVMGFSVTNPRLADGGINEDKLCTPLIHCLGKRHERNRARCCHAMIFCSTYHVGIVGEGNAALSTPNPVQSTKCSKHRQRSTSTKRVFTNTHRRDMVGKYVQFETITFHLSTNGTTEQ
ncbi:hypothetical protein BJ165DRAFT_912107 [Panaeolus papilionaceus]|nr:hypothetical protein BJ165DRAFT_912107 [Panaeolus papilionaceus]